jgi:hypothetical protein
MPRIIYITMIAFVAATGPALAGEVKFVMSQGSHAFAATLGKQCLADEGASIEASGNIVTVRDRPDCAAEIREIAANWVIFASDSIVTFTGTPAALTMVRRSLEERLGRSPSSSLHFLARTQNCRCLAFIGKRRAEAAVIAESVLPRVGKDERAKTTVESDRVLFPHPGQKSSLEGPTQDLIKDVGTSFAAPPSA